MSLRDFLAFHTKHPEDMYGDADNAKAVADTRNAEYKKRQEENEPAEAQRLFEQAKARLKKLEEKKKQ